MNIGKIYVVIDGTLLSRSSNPSNPSIICDHIDCSVNDSILYREGPGVTSGLTLLAKIGANWEAVWGSEMKGRIFDTLLDISLVYHEGKELHFMGFSRGATECRSIVAIIRRIGIVKRGPDSKAHLKEALKEYYRVNKMYQTAYYSEPQDVDTLAQCQTAYEKPMSESTSNFHCVPNVNSLYIFDTVPGLPPSCLMEHDLHEKRGFVKRWAHMMATEVTPPFQNYSYVRHADKNRFRCAKIDEEIDEDQLRVERLYFGDHCNVGGSWLVDPRHHACISNNVLRDMLALCTDWKIKPIPAHEYPCIPDAEWRVATGVFGIFPKHKKPKHDDEMGHVMPYMYVTLAMFNGAMKLDRENTFPGDLNVNFYPPLPDYTDVYKNMFSSVFQTTCFLVNHFGGHMLNVSFITAQSEWFSLLVRGSGGTAMHATSGVLGVYLFVLTDMLLVLMRLKSASQVGVNTVVMLGAAGAVLSLGPFVGSGWAILVATQGSYYFANTFLTTDNLNRQVRWLRG